MSEAKKQIIEYLKSYIDKRDSDYSRWCIGIGGNAQEVFINVQKADDCCWVFKYAPNAETAIEIRDYFINTVGLEKCSGSSDNLNDIIYLYKKQLQHQT
jgi:hypothetical protein